MTDQAPRVPVWVIVVVWALSAALAFGAFWLVLLIAAFGCDSGWEGCGDAAGNAMGIYVVIALLSLVLGLVWAVVGRSRTQQILACVLIPAGVVVAVVAAVGYYAWMASRAGGLA